MSTAGAYWGRCLLLVLGDLDGAVGDPADGLGAPLRSTAVPRTATGPTSTPQTAAATSAATATLARRRMSTLPTATLTRPFWPWVMSALAGAAVAVSTAAPVARVTRVVRTKRVI